MESDSRIVSFVLRFVHEEPSGEPHEGSTERSDRRAGGWYSVIRHVQSDTERRFTRWEDCEAFISMYVDLGKDARHD